MNTEVMYMVTKRALYVGRFQPFHLGHLKALKWILEREDEVVVCIGSPQYSFTKDNPFTLGERIEMIWAVLREEGLTDRCIIASVPDTYESHHLWVPLVLSYCPKFERVYTNDEMSRMLFTEAGIEVRSIPFFDREILCATRIRKLMAENKNWREFVHPAVARVIDSIDGVNRVKRILSIR